MSFNLQHILMLIRNLNILKYQIQKGAPLLQGGPKGWDRFQLPHRHVKHTSRCHIPDGIWKSGDTNTIHILLNISLCYDVYLNVLLFVLFQQMLYLSDTSRVKWLSADPKSIQKAVFNQCSHWQIMFISFDIVTFISLPLEMTQRCQWEDLILKYGE